MKARIIIGIYEYLHQHGKITASYIASEWDISERTAYRYLDELSCIMPLVTARGKNGGYILLNY